MTTSPPTDPEAALRTMPRSLHPDDAPAPRVSVVIPAFNRAATIRGAIESVLAQSFTDLELLVVDDASTDATAERVRAIADPRVRMLANPRNMGAGAARNTGLRAARGDWVAFQDSDDEWLPRKLERQMARLDTPGADWIAAYCGMLVLGTAESHTPETGARPKIDYLPAPGPHRIEGDLRRALLDVNSISPQTLIARRAVLERIGGFDESLPAVEDWDLALRLAQEGAIACIDEPLVIQRFSTNSLSLQISRRLEARTAILIKHHALFAADPALLARHHAGHATLHARLGERAKAWRALRAALALRPVSPRLWARALTLALPRRTPPR